MMFLFANNKLPLTSQLVKHEVEEFSTNDSWDNRGYHQIMVGHLWKSCGAECDELMLCWERVPILRKGLIIIYVYMLEGVDVEPNMVMLLFYNYWRR